jgi:hypothetical protein
MGETKKPAKTSNAKKNEVKMISVEEANTQMQSVFQQAQARIQQLTTSVQQLDAMLRDKTIDNLFKVLEYKASFEEDFVVKCTNVIQKYLTQVALTEPEKVVKDEEIPTLPVEEV